MWFQVLEEIPSKVPATVIEPKLLVHSPDLSHVVLVQLEVALEISPHPRGGFGLGEHRVALRNSPGCTSVSFDLNQCPTRAKPTNRHLRPGLSILLPDLSQDGLIDQLAQFLAHAGIDFI